MTELAATEQNTETAATGVDLPKAEDRTGIATAVYPEAGAELSDEEETLVLSEEFLLGELIKTVSRPFKTLLEPWNKLSEHEQANFMRQVADNTRNAVRAAVECIASGDRVNFRAHVEQVQFKQDGVKCQLTLPNSPEAHRLADVTGQSIMVVIEDSARYLNVGDACKGDPDQPSLFDASAGGTEPDANVAPLPTDQEDDDLYEEAKRKILAKQDASINFLQRTLKIGYNRAARMMERMEAEKVVSPIATDGTRKVWAKTGEPE
ncbi:DNA translocase FtsK [Chitinimonas naiadis]